MRPQPEGWGPCRALSAGALTPGARGWSQAQEGRARCGLAGVWPELPKWSQRTLYSILSRHNGSVQLCLWDSTFKMPLPSPIALLGPRQPTEATQ